MLLSDKHPKVPHQYHPYIVTLIYTWKLSSHAEGFSMNIFSVSDWENIHLIYKLNSGLHELRLLPSISLDPGLTCIMTNNGRYCIYMYAFGIWECVSAHCESNPWLVLIFSTKLLIKLTKFLFYFVKDNVIEICIILIIKQFNRYKIYNNMNFKLSYTTLFKSLFF